MREKRRDVQGPSLGKKIRLGKMNSFWQGMANGFFKQRFFMANILDQVLT